MSTVEFDEIDISSEAFWSLESRQRDERFAELRRNRPVSYQRLPPNAITVPGGDNGFWALVRHADVVAASRNSDVFRSGLGVGLDDLPIEVVQSVSSFVAMDAPRHSQLRRLVTAAFTPRAVAQLKSGIYAKAKALVDAAIDREAGDFVTEVAMPLPLWTVSEMMGVPEALRSTVVECANVLVGRDDPELRADTSDKGTGAFLTAAAKLIDIATDLANDRRRSPQEDLMTVLATGAVEGETLSDADIGAFFVLLAVAGNDTTRHTTSWTALALQNCPDQYGALRANSDELMRTAVDEFVRWASPVQHFRRTTSRDVQIHGTSIPAGSKVVLFYGSANRDEDVFPHPWQFDVRRDPNHHVGFGGGGAHMCLGVHVARTQLAAVFTELLAHGWPFVFGSPDVLVGSFINGVKRLPYQVVDHVDRGPS